MEYNGRLEDKDGNIFNPKTTPKQAGLGNVKDYPINSDINANSDKEYASTSMVAKVREEKSNKIHDHGYLYSNIKHVKDEPFPNPEEIPQGLRLYFEMGERVNQSSLHITLLTIRGYGSKSDFSGGNLVQFGFPSNNSKSIIFRSGNNTGWTGWQSLLTQAVHSTYREAEEKLLQLELEALNV